MLRIAIVIWLGKELVLRSKRNTLIRRYTLTQEQMYTRADLTISVLKIQCMKATSRSFCPSNQITVCIYCLYYFHHFPKRRRLKPVSFLGWILLSNSWQFKWRFLLDHWRIARETCFQYPVSWSTCCIIGENGTGQCCVAHIFHINNIYLSLRSLI